MTALTALHRKFDTNFEVQKIIDERQSEDGGETQYLVRWNGYGAAEDQWLSEESMPAAASLILSAWNGGSQQHAQGDQPCDESDSDNDSDDDDEVAHPPYCIDGVLTLTGAQILRNEGWQQTQSPQPSFRIGEDSSEEDDDDVDDSDDEDTAPKKMDVLSIAVREFLVLVDQPETGIATPDTQTISQLLPDNPRRSVLSWASGWAERPAHGHTKGKTYMCGEFEQVVKKLFNRGEKKKGCKYSPHQIHSELESRFPDRFDVPSVTEISGAVANLVQKKKTGSTSGNAAAGGGRGRMSTEGKYPEVFAPLWAEWRAGWHLSPKEACSWLAQHKPGQLAGNWPVGLDWPNKMKTHVTNALKRFREGRPTPTVGAE